MKSMKETCDEISNSLMEVFPTKKIEIKHSYDPINFTPIFGALVDGVKIIHRAGRETPSMVVEHFENEIRKLN